MANSAASLQSIVEGIFRTRASTVAPAGFAIAPLVPNATLAAQYAVLRTSGESSVGRADFREGNGESSISADFQDGQYDIVRAEFALKNFKSKARFLPQQLGSGTNGVDFLEALTAYSMDELYAYYVNHFMAVSATLPNASTLNLTTNNAGITELFDGYINTIQLATGKKPNVVHVGKKTMQRLLRQDDVQEGPGITGYTSSGSAVRRLGAAVPERLAAYFRDVHSLELVVEDRVAKNASGTDVFLADSGIVLAHAAGGPLDSALKTFHFGPDILTFLTEETSIPRGTRVAAEGDFVVHKTDESAGLYIPVTLA